VSVHGAVSVVGDELKVIINERALAIRDAVREHWW
jgi:hypothetical protein